jgi:signal transduction histidine kinase
MSIIESADFKKLFEQSPGLYLILSTDLHIVAATDNYLAATLTKRDVITGMYLFDVFPDNPADPETRAVDTMSASIKRVFDTKNADSFSIQRHDVRSETPDGTIFVEKYWRPTNIPLFNEQGEIKYILHTVDDVTEFVKLQKKGELDYDRHVKHLEAVNEKLLHANQELEQLVYAASHDLQEPLRTVMNYITLLNEDYLAQLDETADRYLHNIERSTGKMQNLIKDLLDYSRIGRMLVVDEINTIKVVEEVISELQASIDESGALIKLNNLPVIRGDEVKIRQLFLNLLSNAIKFRNKDVTPEIMITCKDEGSAFHFTISDNGIGIEEKFITKLFVIFQRLHTDKEYKGTGIGLAICKKIVLLHHGKIWIDSIPGVGTSFHFTLPKNL